MGASYPSKLERSGGGRLHRLEGLNNPGTWVLGRMLRCESMPVGPDVNAHDETYFLGRSISRSVRRVIEGDGLNRILV
jgi:hypothetical protein